MHEYSQPIEVARNSVVLVITQSDLSEPSTTNAVGSCFRRINSALIACSSATIRFFAVLRQTIKDPLLLRFPQIMRETQEREGFRLSLSPLFPVPSGVPPELDQPRLVRV
jgi:hypothetical protein